MMSYLELAQAYAKACRERDMALAQLADIGAGYAEKMDDFVRVVRCKDCRLSEKSCFGEGWRFCANNKLHHKQSSFCCYGERGE